MGNFVRVAQLSDVKPGQMKAFAVDGKRVLISNVQGTLFATEDVCTHDNGTLSDGELIGDEIECPRHGGRFSARTGKVLAMPPMFPIKTFPVKVEGDEILVAVET